MLLVTAGVQNDC